MAEIESKRTKDSKTFDLGGGKYRTEIGSHSHTFKNSAWIETDTDIVVSDGTDPDSGDKYFATSKVDFLDFDIKFKENDPLTLKVKHIPTGNKIYLKPVGAKNKPVASVAGNKMHVVQAWDGIDVDIYVTDSGIKTDYTITSPAGQTVVGYKLTGDVGFFAFPPPVYTSNNILIIAPSSIVGDDFTMDFSSVPVGTVVDPTVTIQPTSATAWMGSSSPNNNVGNYSQLWLGDNSNSLNVGQRSLLKFDLSSIPGGSTIDSAYIQLFVDESSNNFSSSSHIKLSRVLRNWVYDQATWNSWATSSSWTTAGAASDGNDITSTNQSSTALAGGTYTGGSLQLTGLAGSVTDMLASSNYGWLMWSDFEFLGVAGVAYFYFAGHTNATPSHKPQLVVDYSTAVAGGGRLVGASSIVGNSALVGRGNLIN